MALERPPGRSADVASTRCPGLADPGPRSSAPRSSAPRSRATGIGAPRPAAGRCSTPGRHGPAGCPAAARWLPARRCASAATGRYACRSSSGRRAALWPSALWPTARRLAPPPPGARPRPPPGAMAPPPPGACASTAGAHNPPVHHPCARRSTARCARWSTTECRTLAATRSTFGPGGRVASATAAADAATSTGRFGAHQHAHGHLRRATARPHR